MRFDMDLEEYLFLEMLLLDMEQSDLLKSGVKDVKRNYLEPAGYRGST